MIQICRYDSVKDIKKTIPNLAMSIEDAMLTGVISATGTEIPYTDETEVENVGSYLHDNIEVAMAAKKLGQSMSAAEIAMNNANPKGENS